jgi:hypothetical protein
MKRLVTVFGTVIILFFSCKKEQPLQLQVLPDSICHTDVDPDLEISPIDSIIQIPFNPCSCIPSPANGIVELELDVDCDGNNDFKIVYRHYYQQVSASSPCVNYMRTLTIESLDQDGGIAVTAYNNAKTKSFKSGDVIDQNEFYMWKARIYEETAFSGYVDFGNEGFVGVKLSNGSVGWIHIKHEMCAHKCIITDYSINRTSTNSILAGQIG